MFSIICSIFVTLIISTNAGGPSVKCAAEQPTLNALRNQLSIGETNAKQAIDEYAKKYLSPSPIDDFKNGIKNIINDRYGAIEHELNEIVKPLERSPPGTYDLTCFDIIKTEFKNSFDSVTAYGNEIIDKEAKKVGYVADENGYDPFP